jgi:mono/diheme cytochrome c family protein
MRTCVTGHFRTSNRRNPKRPNGASHAAFAAAGFVVVVVVALLSFGRSVVMAQGAGDAQNGKKLFADKGCVGCHGPDARGMLPTESPTGGPRIAPPPLAMAAFVDFVRNPTGKMVPFSAQDISDAQLGDVYAYLQSAAPGGAANGNGGVGNGNAQGGGGRQAAAPGQAIDSMSDVMTSMVYPATNNILFFVYRGGPQNDTDWTSVQRSAVLLAESGNVLLMRGPTGDQGDWAKDARALVEAGAAVYRAARAKDTKTLLTTDQAINASCVTCHKQYRFTGAPEKSLYDSGPPAPARR